MGVGPSRSKLSGATRWLHLLVGIAAAVLAAAHLVAVRLASDRATPFSSIGFAREMDVVGLAVLLPSLAMAATAVAGLRRGRAAPGSILSALLLAAASLALFSRYFDGFDTALALAALTDALLLAAAHGEGVNRLVHVARSSLLGLLLAAAAALLGFSWLGGSREPRIVEVRAPAPRPPARPVIERPCLSIDEALRTFALDDTARAELLARLDRHANDLDRAEPGLRPALCRAILDDLTDKRRALDEGALFPADRIAREAIDFERFRLETWLSSGVAPRRYFGFFDEQGATAAHERALRETLLEAVPITNAYAAERGLLARLSDGEVAVTFLAEGGALLLTERTWTMDRIHPVRGIGLDSFREAFARHPELVRRLDERFHTALGRLLVRAGKRELLLRPMTFREALLGVTVLYLYEKQITAARLPPAGPSSLMAQPLDRQLAATSLVYNSGLSFDAARVDQLLAFDTADYLATVEERNRASRRPLAVRPRAEMLRLARDGQPIPPQPTSWSAVFHVLQRYGAWVALRRFGNVFDERGAFVRR